MSDRALSVIIGDCLAGTLRQGPGRSLSFAYDDAYDGPPLSLAMPVDNRTYPDKVVQPYLFGLLPDSEHQRRALANEFDASANDPFGLLAHIGLDCPGAVQFCSPEAVAEALAQPGEYRPIDSKAIAERLSMIRDDEGSTWQGASERWSLGGNQGKFALALRNGAWCECLGSAATTHIFKNGVVGYRLQALNEYVCMTAARLVGLPAARVSYEVFEDEPALIVERYDRLQLGDGRVARIHQEDLCQCLGVMPDRKYTSDGGPTTRDALMLMARTSRPEQNLKGFAEALFFNCLIGAPDAHAKNYSLMLGRGGDALLAPLYDVASGLAYEQMQRKGRLAMSIGGENRFGRVSRGALERFAGSGDRRLREVLEGHGVTAAWCIEVMAQLGERLPQAMERAFYAARDLPGAEEPQERLDGPVAENCRRTLALL